MKHHSFILLLAMILCLSVGCDRGAGPSPDPYLDEPEEVEAPDEVAAETDPSLKGTTTHRTVHYELITDCDDATAKEHLRLLESAHDAYRQVFQGLYRARGGKSKVYVYKSIAPVTRLAGRQGVPGFYASEGHASLPDQTVVTCVGGYKTKEAAYASLLHNATYQFEDKLVPDMANVPVWLLEGIAAFFAAGRIEDGRFVYKESGSKELGLIPRDRLAMLQGWIREKKQIRLRKLIRIPASMLFDAFHYPHGWSLIYWMLNAEERKYQGVFRQIWKTAQEKPVTPEDVEEIFLDATGVTFDQYQVKIWKPYVLGLVTPAAGTVEGDLFTSDAAGFTVSRPGAAWTWVLEGLTLEQQVVMTHTSGDARIFVLLREDWSQEGSRRDSRGVLRGAIEDTRARLEEAWGEGPSAERIEIGGFPGARFDFAATIELPVPPPPEGEEPGEPPTLEMGFILAILPEPNRTYEVFCEAPTEVFEKYAEDFEKALEALRLLD